MARSKLKVLRIASITDDLVCDELHQSAPGSVTAGRDVESQLLVFGPTMPGHHVLFELDKQGGYTLVLPAWSSGLLKLRGKAMRIADLWRKQSKDGPLRLRLDPSARGKLVLGETALLFQFAPPAPVPPKEPFPQELSLIHI